jgi:hypothetical protein
MKINRGCIKLKLQRHLSAQEIWNQIMDVHIQALESLLEDKSLDKWKIIFPCYGTSLEAVESMAREYIEAFKMVQGNMFNERYEDVETMLVTGLNQRWFNTIMSTLYMMEDDLMEMSSDSVFTLWDIFFTCQALRKENNVVAMRLNTFELKGQ